MSVEFTLNNLYSNGVIDYIPYDLCTKPHATNQYDTSGLYPKLDDSFEYKNHKSEEPTKKSIYNSQFIKGLVAIGILVITTVGILKGHKKNVLNSQSCNQNKESFWSKLNPKNWFKKK